MGDTQVGPAAKKPEIVKRTLKCILSRAEREEMATRQSRAIEEYASTKEELDTIKAQYKAKLTGLEGEIAASARTINAGYQMKQVECQVDRVFETRTVHIIRTDDWTVVESRNMTNDELQRKLDLDLTVEAAAVEQPAQPESPAGTPVPGYQPEGAQDGKNQG